MAAALTELSSRRIEPATTGPITEDHVPVLLWVHSGTAIVEVGGVPYRLSPNEAIWVPPGISHCTRTDEGGVVIPIFPRLPELRGPLAEVRVLSIPDGWEDWLMFQFDFNSYHSIHTGGSAQALIALVTESPAPTEHPIPASVPLPIPRSREGRAVAQTLLRSPGSPRTVDVFAERENVSARTLQRQFRYETGMMFSEWRTRARIAVAIKYLADGYEIGWTGRYVGYATPAGFTRAFRRHADTTPQEFARRLGTRDHTSIRSIDQVSALVAIEPRESPGIPARKVWSWVYDWHVLWWAYRGTATMRIGTREFSIGQGQAIWLPAGFSASVNLTEGSILLPLGNRYGGTHISVDEIDVFWLPNDAEAYLLHTLLTEYTLFRTESNEASVLDQLFREQFAPSRAISARAEGIEMTGAVSAIARELRRDPANSRSLTDWAHHLRLSPQEVSREFRTQMGTSFPRWRAHLRMSLARELLMLDEPPHEVADFLGYANRATFSKIFTTAHGISPRSYQRQISKQPS